jgi:hypothetical protein
MRDETTLSEVASLKMSRSNRACEVDAVVPEALLDVLVVP